jgi:hypothetical protein
LYRKDFVIAVISEGWEVCEQLTAVIESSRQRWEQAARMLRFLWDDYIDEQLKNREYARTIICEHLQKLPVPDPKTIRKRAK